ncbi:MAG: hypothetical protein ABIG93_03055 [archaeon]|nr:hypothetical protein [Nanoarchaeota archaeon]
MAYKWTSKDKAEIFLSTIMIILMIVALYIGNNIIVNINEVNEGLDRTTKIINDCNACQEPEQSKLVPGDTGKTVDENGTENLIEPVDVIEIANISNDNPTIDFPVAGTD